MIDVGANDGGYGREIRRFGYEGRIASFEPTSDARRRLESAADNNWEIYPFALGSSAHQATINVAANAGASSSFLSMKPAHEKAAPAATYVSVETVNVRRLDDFWDAIIGSSQRPFLKLDVQGYEMQVLEGASSTLDHVVGLVAELSLAAVYDEAPSWIEMVEYLTSRGFEIYRIDPGFADAASGQMLQVDGMFFHGDRASLL